MGRNRARNREQRAFEACYRNPRDRCYVVGVPYEVERRAESEKLWDAWQHPEKPAREAFVYWYWYFQSQTPQTAIDTYERAHGFAPNPSVH
jgi:hypothetical protein